MAENSYTYFESKNIKVYPSAYRATFNREHPTQPVESNTVATTTFDPEARLTTERNLASSTVSDIQESYVIDYDSANSILKCVIGGYYFEIYNFTLPVEDVYLAVKLRQVMLTPTVIVDGATYETQRNTYVLDSFLENGADGNILDQLISNTWQFTGLAKSTTIITGNNVKCLHLSTNQKIFAANYLVKNIRNLPGTNQALNGALRLGNYNEANELYGNTAYGANSISFGSSVSEMLSKAIGDFSIAGGEGATATKVGSIAIGKNVLADGKYSQAFGEGTQTQEGADNQFVFGKYNQVPSSGTYAELVGWGTDSTHKNIRTLNSNGDETLSGKLTAWQGGIFYGNTLVEGGNVTFNTNGTTENKLTQIGHPYHPSGELANKNNGTFRLYASNVDINSDSNDGPVTIGNLGTNHNTTINGYNITVKSNIAGKTQINTGATSSSVHDGNTEIGNNYANLTLKGGSINITGDTTLTGNLTIAGSGNIITGNLFGNATSATNATNVVITADTAGNDTIAFKIGTGSYSKTVNDVAHASGADAATKATYDSSGTKAITTYGAKIQNGNNNQVQLVNGNNVVINTVTINDVAHALNADYTAYMKAVKSDGTSLGNYQIAVDSSMPQTPSQNVIYFIY